MGRAGQGSGPVLIGEILDRLHYSGWSGGVTDLTTEAGGRVWLVGGTNGENVIRAAVEDAADGKRPRW